MDHFYKDIPGWFGFQAAYDHILRALPADEPSVFVEVGSWKGRSTAYLGVEVYNSGKPITVYAVDTFAGSDEEVHRQDPDIDRLREVFDRNLAPVRDALGPRFKVLQMTSVQASGRFKDRELDAVWLDASHEVDDVMTDIDVWWPALKAGGWMGGDDLNWTGVYTAVANRFPVITVGNLAEQPWWLTRRGS